MTLRSVESLAGGALVLAGLLLFLSGMAIRLFWTSLGGGWIEVVTIYLVSWGLLLSAASCVAHREHVRADFFIRMLGPAARRAADALAAAAGLAFCLALAWFGWAVVEFAVRLDERGPSFLQIPTFWFYAALPVSMLACGVRYAVQLAAILRDREPPTDSGTP